MNDLTQKEPNDGRPAVVKDWEKIVAQFCTSQYLR